jgi:hypothetical protein
MEWISVKDRLPNGPYDVLVQADYNQYIASHKDGSWYDRYGQVYVSNVTHWQPLPEPPKD